MSRRGLRRWVRWSAPLLSLGLVLGCGASEDPSTHDHEERPLLPSEHDGTPPSSTWDASAFELESARIGYDGALDTFIFEQAVTGRAGSVGPEAAGQLDGAPVMAYVFVTSLRPEQVGFGDVEGTVALALASHPDFDDTPLYDENVNGAHGDDGMMFHSHWVVLVEDERAPGGLAVKQAAEDDALPPSAPLPMYLDSPGFPIVRDGHVIRAAVPRARVGHAVDFQFNALTVYMEVDAKAAPLLALHEVYSSLSEDGSLPFRVEVGSE